MYFVLPCPIVSQQDATSKSSLCLSLDLQYTGVLQSCKPEHVHAISGSDAMADTAILYMEGLLQVVRSSGSSRYSHSAAQGQELTSQAPGMLCRTAVLAAQVFHA